jgi:hypothetical protein
MRAGRTRGSLGAGWFEALEKGGGAVVMGTLEEALGRKLAGGRETIRGLLEDAEREGGGHQSFKDWGRTLCSNSFCRGPHYKKQHVPTSFLSYNPAKNPNLFLQLMVRHIHQSYPHVGREANWGHQWRS